MADYNVQQHKTNVHPLRTLANSSVDIEVDMSNGVVQATIYKYKNSKRYTADGPDQVGGPNGNKKKLYAQDQNADAFELTISGLSPGASDYDLKGASRID